MKKLSNINNEAGAIPILLLLAVVGLLIYLFATNTFSFKDRLFNTLFPKPPSHAAEPSVPGEVIVKFKPGVSDEAKDNIRRAHGLEKESEVEQIGVELNKVPEKAKDKIIEALNKNPRVEYAEPNILGQLQDTPNDPFLTNQWFLPKIAASSAWDISKGNSNVVVAVIDSGVKADHEDLIGKIVPGYNYYDNNTDTSDKNGHGTGVVGVVAASTNNGIGVASLGRDIAVMPLVVCSTGCSAYGTTKSLVYAVDHGAKAANISIAWGSSVSSMHDAIYYAWDKGVITVAAAGNYAMTPLVYPASEPIVISAGMTDPSDTWIGSNYGANLDIVAPGLSIYTTTKIGGYAPFSGTSFSSPLTAALVALIYSAKPDLTTQQVTDIITSTADKVGGATYDSNGWNDHYGFGRINAGAALQKAVGSTAPPPDTAAPNIVITFPTAGSTISGIIDFTADVTDNVGVTKVEFWCDNFCVRRELAIDTTFPYSVSWDTTKERNELKYLHVRAYDGAGNMSMKTITVTVSNISPDTTPPTTSITQPANGSTVSGSVNIQAQASDDVLVSSVSIFVDGAILTSCSGSSCSYNWDTTQTGNGSHTIQSKALDSSNNLGQSAIITVNVSNITSSPTPIPSSTSTPTPNPILPDSESPTVSVTNPIDGSLVSRNSTVNITASATDNVKVSKVEFYVNNSLKCTSAVSPYTCSWKVLGRKNASYTISAKAYDATNPPAQATITVKAQ
ncbi:MAG: Ig-like domain-containing protein [Candidatus Daviesbacteria bacterium]|nr:Ig-like domain-containing protein [Candidatus Daviesbacteria bacterium]